ncbi:MbtH family protein [Micromonospora sp. WMMD882]|uniref:MbtH family protein n=1 Tax=Micromonospora sp. WMMD882 TaxID=3015151 RepID=UPI00248CD9DC|nr:MbtH family protein [Micromonospora sp. WMMD882]WBB80482.1 MbtH family protein [Micromonospora sp. WMMD882]
MNPFDDENGTFFVLANAEGQHSLWPEFAEVPAGWTVEWGPGGREEALRHVEENWLDMRPKSLALAMARAEKQGR